MNRLSLVPMSLDDIFSALHAKDKAWLQSRLKEINSRDSFQEHLVTTSIQDEQLTELSVHYSDGQAWLDMLSPTRSVPMSLREAIRSELLVLSKEIRNKGDGHG